MIKFTGTGPKGRMLFLGLSDKNLQLLREGRPIKVIGAEVGVDHDVVIFHGRTEQEMVDSLQRNGVDFSGVPIRRHNDDDRQEGGEH